MSVFTHCHVVLGFESAKFERLGGLPIEVRQGCYLIRFHNVNILLTSRGILWFHLRLPAMLAFRPTM